MCLYVYVYIGMYTYVYGIIYIYQTLVTKTLYFSRRSFKCILYCLVLLLDLQYHGSRFMGQKNVFSVFK